MVGSHEVMRTRTIVMVNGQMSTIPPMKSRYVLGCDARKPVFRVPDKVNFKPACSATETSYKIKILLVASLNMILSNKRITKALIRLRGCAGWSAPLLFPYPQRQI